MEIPSTRVRVLIGLLTSSGQLNTCVLVSEDDLPLASPHVVIARDPDDVKKVKGLPPK